MKLSIFSLMIAIAVALLSLFQFERYQTFELAMESQIQSLSNQLQPQIQTLQKEYSHILLKETEQTIHQPTTLWVESEIEYLMNLANTQLQIMNDIAGALQLIKTTESLLSKLDHPKASDFKTALTADKIQLESVKDPDINELWNKITVLMNVINDLPTRSSRQNKIHVNETISHVDQSVNTLFENKDNHHAATTSISSPNQPTTHTAGAATETNWKTALSSSWQELKQLIIIRHHDKPIEPILSENQAQIAKEILRLLLVQLRLAILQKEQTIYKNLLQESKAWLDNYFENTHPFVIDIKQTLTELENVNLKPTVPSLQHSLTVLQNLRK